MVDFFITLSGKSNVQINTDNDENWESVLDYYLEIFVGSTLKLKKTAMIFVSQFLKSLMIIFQNQLLKKKKKLSWCENQWTFCHIV